MRDSDLECSHLSRFIGKIGKIRSKGVENNRNFKIFEHFLKRLWKCANISIIFDHFRTCFLHLLKESRKFPFKHMIFCILIIENPNYNISSRTNELHNVTMIICTLFIVQCTWLTMSIVINHRHDHMIMYHWHVHTLEHVHKL